MYIEQLFYMQKGIQGCTLKLVKRRSHCAHLDIESLKNGRLFVLDYSNMYGQQRTPEFSAFFAPRNVATIQAMIQKEVLQQCGVRVNDQNPSDLRLIMESVYSVNASHVTTSQVPTMNMIVVRQAADQVVSGIRMYQQYIRDISTPILPNTLPENKSIYGKKIGFNNNIGWRA
jgi:Family of unknown function (DUF5761)